MKPFEQWTVLPHTKLVRVDDDVLTVTGTLKTPLGDIDRRMTVVRLHDGRLVIYSAIALDETEMATLEGFGTPAFLIVPNDIHRLDAKAWKNRYPQLQVIAPAAAREKVAEVVPVDGVVVDFGDPSVRLLAVPGTADREAALVVQTATGTTIVLNDLVFDMANRPGIRGFILKAIGMSGDEPHIPPVVKMREVVDKDALRAQLEEWSRLPNLERVIISHGKIIEAGAAPQLLGKIAEDLAA